MKPKGSASLRMRVAMAAVAVGLAVVGSLVAITPAADAATAATVQTASTVETAVDTGLVKTADLSQFQAGNIISDAVFYDSSTMSQSQIQDFLNSKVSSCKSGYTCLKSWSGPSSSQSANAMCSAFSGSSGESAASLIYRVAQACGINPQVLLVMIQKEQGLVTSTAPSTYGYNYAMGYNCPDTTGCTSDGLGFATQVYGGAYMLKRYSNPTGTSKYFTWYAPGNTWSILYNPSTSCGSSGVYIQNQATANLYYYTPYQPNAAALAAGYGTGDSCSAYGNRNFYNYFTDWFGSTQSVYTPLVRTDSDGAIYLLSGTTRWHITSLETYTDLASVFGAFGSISTSSLSRYTSGGDLNEAILRDSTTGEIALFQDGARHRFSTCDLVTLWGGSCNVTIDVATDVFTRGAAGSEMTSYFRVRSTSEWGRLNSAQTSTTLWNEAAARSLAGSPDSAIFAAYLPSIVFSGLTRSAMEFAAGSLVKANESDRVYMTIGFDTLVWVPSWAAVAEYGLSGADVVSVPKATLFAGYTQSDSSVQPTLSCGGVAYYPAGGALHRIGSVATGLSTMTSGSPATCAAFAVGADATGPIFIKSVSSATVWAVTGGARHQVLDWTSLLGIAGTANPTILTVNSSTVSALPVGSVAGDGIVVKGSAAMLYVVNGDSLLPIPSYAIAGEWGLNTNFLQVDDAAIAASTVTLPIGLWATCGTTTLFAASGTLTPAAAAGFSATALSDASCRRLSADTTAAATTVYVKSPTNANVYLASGGSYHLVSSWSRLLELTGGATPMIRIVGSATLDGLPKGAAA